MKKYTTFGLIATAIIAGIAATPAQDKVSVKFKLDKDANVSYKSTIKTDMDIMGTTQSNTIQMTQAVSFLELKGGWTTLQLKTKEFKIDGDGMMGMESGLDSMKNITVKMDVDEYGLTRNVVLENTEDVDPMLRQMLSGSMKSDQIAGFMGVHFPKEDIGVGSKWSVTLDAKKMFDLNEMVTAVNGTLPVSYEVKAFETIDGKRLVKIHSTMTGTVNMDIESPAGDLNAAVKMDFATDYWVDVATGILSKSTSTATIDNDFGMGSMTQKMNITVERVK